MPPVLTRTVTECDDPGELRAQVRRLVARAACQRPWMSAQFAARPTHLISSDDGQSEPVTTFGEPAMSRNVKTTS